MGNWSALNFILLGICYMGNYKVNDTLRCDLEYSLR